MFTYHHRANERHRERRLRATGLAGICLLGLLGGAEGQGPSPRGEVGWVGLYNLELLEWLENKNRLEELCPLATMEAAQLPACREEKLNPKQWVFEVRDAPQASGASKGAIVIMATPGEGLRASYRPAMGQPGTEFLPDLLDNDWSYGPYFHQTFLERRGTWFLLPPDPLRQAGWINASRFREDPQVRTLQAGDIVMVPRGDLLVLGVERGVFRARPEQEADMWCREGDPPPLKPAREIRMPVAELYGPTGHLLVGIKYTRGC